MNDLFGLSVKGHVKIEDDLGNVLVDKDNAVHPQNMSRVIARALANEDNFHIHRIAFGNGGTLTDAAFTVTYRTPNDGQPPDTRTWDSRIYNETYSEIIDDNISPSNLLGTDPGSSGPNAGNRPGGGANPSGDPASIPNVSGPGVRSNELGLTSEVVITAVLNPGEPTGQFDSDNQSPSEDTESSFTFDEIGLYTTGAPASASNGSFSVDVGNRTSEDDTGLLANTQYSFIINVDGGGNQVIDFTTPVAGGSGVGGEILYGDLCEAINTGDTNWNPLWSGSNPLPGGATIAITDNTLSFPSISGSQTFGLLTVTSGSTGVTSSVVLADGTTGLNLWDEINPADGGTLLNPGVGNPGQDAGVQNNPVSSSTERERLLTHLIFSPVLKSANRTLAITYTLTVSVARTV
jgi:hypothetical protein